MAVRLRATSEAAGKPEPAVREALLSVFQDPKEAAIVRGAAAMALGKMHDPRLLALTLKQLPEAIRKATAGAPADKLEIYLLGNALVAYGAASLDSLATLLKNPHEAVVAWAVTQHGAYFYNDRAFNVLSNYLDNSNLVLRRAAAKGLARSFHSQAEALALHHLNDPDPQVRFQLAWGLVNWGSVKAVPPLEERLAHEAAPQVKQELTLALAAAKPRASPPKAPEAADPRD